MSGKIPRNSAFAVLVDGEKLLTCRFKHSRLLLPLVTVVSVVFNIVMTLFWLGEKMKIASSLVQAELFVVRQMIAEVNFKNLPALGVKSRDVL